MGQIANQMVIDLFYKLKQKIQGKKAAHQNQKKTDKEEPTTKSDQ